MSLDAIKDHIAFALLTILAVTTSTIEPVEVGAAEAIDVKSTLTIVLDLTHVSVRASHSISILTYNFVHSPLGATSIDDHISLTFTGDCIWTKTLDGT